MNYESSIVHDGSVYIERGCSFFERRDCLLHYEPYNVCFMVNTQ